MKALLMVTMIFGFHAEVAYSQHAHDHGPAADTQAGSARTTEMTEGEVTKIDPDTQKITLKHGELKNLGMPAMTMVFRVSDPAMLARVKTGDKVRFRAERVNGALTVSRIEAAQ